MTILRACGDYKNCYDTNFADDDFQKCPHCGSLNTEVEWNEEITKNFEELQKEIREGIEAYERGEGIPLEEFRKNLGLVRIKENEKGSDIMPSLVLQGAKNSATVFTHNIEETAIGQVIGMLNEPITENTTVAIMPDVHAGAGSTIGTTIRLPENKAEWKVCPNVVGVDIGCSMRAIRIIDEKLDLEKLDKIVNEKVPAGQNIHERVVVNQKEMRNLLKGLSFHIDEKRYAYIMKSCGTLGSGNHYIELGKSPDG